MFRCFGQALSRFAHPWVLAALFVATLFPVFSGTVYGADEFERINSFAFNVLNLSGDARANGMGRAFVAIADGPNATYWNPAGLAQQEGVVLRPLALRDIGSVGSFDPFYYSGSATMGFKNVGLGLMYSRFNRNLDAFPTTSGVLPRFNEVDSAFYLGAAVDLAAWIPGNDQMHWSIGVTAKKIDFGLVDANGWEADLGSLWSWRFSSGFGDVTPRLGVQLSNLIDGELSSSGTHLRLERQAIVGAALEISPRTEPGHRQLWRVLVSGQTDMFYGDLERKPVKRVGVEAVFAEMFAYRAGYSSRINKDDFGFGFRYDQFRWGKHKLGAYLDFALAEDGSNNSELYSLTLTYIP